MAIELPRELRAQMVASIERWFEDERGERIGNIAAGALLGFFMDEVAPTIYNRGVADAQERLLQRVTELDIEVHEDEFQYWRKREPQAKARKR
ncbi:MAG: DUF2164 domain-containing protein [Burkholderiaceae bacterium]|nr:DUF2164 domain-containing protein [Burkholderiaceae bacterium]